MSSASIRTIACSATLAVAAIVGPATAAQAAATAPSGPDAAALRAAGVKVTWPLSGATTSVISGTKLSVRVRVVRGKKRPALVHLALVRTSATGRVKKLVEGAVLRGGVFNVRVPRAAGRHYALTLKAGKVRYTSRFNAVAVSSHDTVPPAAPRPATPGAPVPVPNGPAPMDPCWLPPSPDAATTTASGILHLGATSVVAGQAVPYAIENTGTACLTFGLGYRWERQDGDAWTPVDQQLIVPAIAFVAGPGGTWTGQNWNWGPITAQTDPSFVPGRYRLTVGANWDNEQRQDAVSLSAEIDVTAPPAG